MSKFKHGVKSVNITVAQSIKGGHTGAFEAYLGDKLEGYAPPSAFCDFDGPMKDPKTEVTHAVWEGEIRAFVLSSIDADGRITHTREMWVHRQDAESFLRAKAEARLAGRREGPSRIDRIEGENREIRAELRRIKEENRGTQAELREVKAELGGKLDLLLENVTRPGS